MIGRRAKSPRDGGGDAATSPTAGQVMSPAVPDPGAAGLDHDPRRALQHGVISLSRWTVRLLIIAAGLVATFWVMGQLWSILLPVLFGLLLSTVLWPPVRYLRRHLPNALAALIAVVGLLVVFSALIVALAPQVRSQGQDLVNQASAGLDSLQEWVAGPPLNLGDDAIGELIDSGVSQLQSNGQVVAGYVLSSLGVIGNAVVTLVLALVLAFFFLKDGPRFLPWLRKWTGESTGRHVEEVSGRVWTALGQYVWSQAAVALVDAVFIGLGVWILGVPFALPIAVLTFFGGFVPIVGAFVAGAIATLVALVSGGIWTAVGVLAIVLVVQQLEGNVLQPILVGRSLKIHAAVVIAAVALGGTLFGIIGAFLAVPAVAVVQVIAQYIRGQIGGAPPGEPPVGTSGTSSGAAADDRDRVIAPSEDAPPVQS